MDFAPKSVEELLVYAALLACAALWRANAIATKRCEDRDVENTKRLDLMSRTVVDMQSKAGERTLEREKAMVEINARVADALDRSSEALVSTKELCFRAIKMLRRYGDDHSEASDSSHNLTPSPHPVHHEAVERKRPSTNSDETSRIFRDV
jgi:hypothetical protein